MNLVIDLIVIAIMAICVLLSAKKGFVKTLVEVAGFVAAVVLTFTLSSPLAEVTYNKIIEPPIIEAATKAVSDGAEGGISEALPNFISDNAASLGFSLDEFKGKITDNLTSGTETAVKTASQDIIKPIVTKILGLIYSVVILLILLFVVKILADFINKIFSFSIIGKANRVLGGIIGLPKGIVFAILFCMIISLLVKLGGDFLIFTGENIEKTYVFKLLANIIPFN